MNKEYKEVMNNLKKIPYKDKTDWQKGLDNWERQLRRKEKKRRNIELLVSPEFFDFYS